MEPCPLFRLQIQRFHLCRASCTVHLSSASHSAIRNPHSQTLAIFCFYSTLDLPCSGQTCRTPPDSSRAVPEKRMKIGIQTWGSDGDVRPFIALAAGLRAAGHDVTVAATHVENKDYTGIGQALGFPGATGRPSRPEVHRAGRRTPRDRDECGQAGAPGNQIPLRPLARDILEAAKGLCREHDIVIGHFIVHPWKTVAEQRAGPTSPCSPRP